MIKFLFLYPLAFLVAGCAHTSSPGSLTPRQLNESAADYEGKLVTVYGFLDIEKGKKSDLWLSQAAFEDAAESEELYNCITLRKNENLPMPVSNLNRKYVTISGVFRSNILSGINLNICNRTGLEIVRLESIGSR